MQAQITRVKNHTIVKKQGVEATGMWAILVVATARKFYSYVFVYNSITFHYYQMLLFLYLFLS